LKLDLDDDVLLTAGTDEISRYETFGVSFAKQLVADPGGITHSRTLAAEITLRRDLGLANRDLHDEIPTS